MNRRNGSPIFDLHSYSAKIESFFGEATNVSVKAKHKNVTICVSGDHSKSVFATGSFRIRRREPDLFSTQSDQTDALLEVRVYGEEPHSIQTMWNAIDDWVIRSSNFHSLYELYGHFTEPHPIFSIDAFRIFSKHPIGKFALHASDFKNCSRYFDRTHLTTMFGKVFGTSSFPQLARILRQFRFDIRCHETNIAIPANLYMVAYPFTLPQRKQMNFSMKVEGRNANNPLQAPG